MPIEKSWLRQPASSGSNVNIVFGGDYTYTLGRTLFKYEERGLPTGEGVLVSGGYSIGRLQVQEGLVVDISDPDLLLWTSVDDLVRLHTSSKKLARVRLYLTNGYVECDGWVTGFNAPRMAEDGHAVIKITFDFLIKTKDTTNLGV